MHGFFRSPPLNQLLFLQIAGDRTADLGTEVVHRSKTRLTATTDDHRQFKHSFKSHDELELNWQSSRFRQMRNRAAEPAFSYYF